MAVAAALEADLPTCKYKFKLNPLYLSYLIFFSPYIFRFISFISPLFLTTSLLLLLSLITTTTLPHSNLGFIQTLIHKLRSKMNDDGDNDHDDFRQFEDLELYKIVFHGPPLLTVGDGDGDGENVHVAVTDRVTESEDERSLESLFEELDRFDASTAAGELQKLENMTSSFSGEDQETDEDSSSVELESSSSFGSCGSTTASSPIDEVAGELRTLELVTSSVSDDEQKTVKLYSTAEVEMKDYKTTSHVREVLKKFEPVTSSISGEYKKSVQNSFAVKSNSTTAIEMKNNKTTSHVQGAFQKSSPVTSSISGEDKNSVQNLFSVKSKSMPAVEMKNNETTSNVNGVFKVTSSISGEDQKTVSSNSTAEIELKDNKTTSFVHRELHKFSPVTSSYSGEEKSSVQNSPSLQVNSWRLDSTTSFGSYGSMRKEKEWKRTLACKLFEERNNSEGGEEGMDSLWEAYEDDNSRKSKNRKEAVGNKKKTKSELKYLDGGEDDEDDEDEDEFMSNGQLCCLKALKLSTGKMNLGMGKPNLVKITKAIKGFGWLHHVGGKHGKKH